MLAWPKLIGRCTISCISVLLTQFALFLVPLFFSASPILIQLTLSALVLLVVVGFGGWCRRLLGFHASAPAFVFFSIFFLWGVYIAIIRQAISRFMDIVFNGEMIMLIIGLCKIMLKDPGFVAQESNYSDELDESSVLGIQTHNEGSLLQMRVRYCKNCKKYVHGFDHHCPAFGNCIGQKNYALFFLLLVGFITTETFYIIFTFQLLCEILEISLPLLQLLISLNAGLFTVASKFPVLEEIRLQNNFISVMARSTSLFSLLQVLWQGLFLIWHVYCICFNIRTEEWVNWKKYPEFQISVSSLPGDYPEIRFKNPYNKGILQNVKDFLTLK